MRRAAILLAALVLPHAIRGQSPTSVTVRGVVLDASASLALRGAQVTLAAANGRTVFSPAGGSPLLSDVRVTTTDTAGAYEIRGLPPGQYQMLVRRLGYEPANIDVDLTETSGVSRLSVGLVVVPVRLRALRVEGERLNSFGQVVPASNTTEASPADAARARQSQFLASDARELTATGALEAGSLGDVDLFRAIRRMPGVTGFDDRSAELWIRGGRWDQVRVAYDGLPLFNPFHASGTMSGVSGDAIGSAVLHPGVRSVSMFDQGPSLIDIRSRAATDSGIHMSAEGSFHGLSATLEAMRPDGRGGMTFSGRRSFQDKLNFWYMPYWNELQGGHYSELAFRGDRRFDGNRSIEISALRTRDFLYNGLTETRDGLVSGSFLTRLTFTTPVRGLFTSHTVGFSTYDDDGTVSMFPWGAVDTTKWSDTTLARFDFQASDYRRRGSRISFLTLRGDLRASEARDASWTGGYQLSSYDVYSYAPANSIYWSDLSPHAVGFSQATTIGSAWAEKRWAPIAPLTVNGGLRLELGSVGARLAPSLQGRYRLDGVTSLSLGAARNYQDAQELPTAVSGYQNRRGLWLLSGGGVRPLRSDQMHLGLQRWIGESLLVDANLYARRLSDMAVGRLPNGDTLTHVLYSTSQLNAHGLEIGARKLTGRFTSSVGYSYGQARETIEGTTFTASGDRTHSVDATAMLRLGQLRLGSAYTYMTGSPYTRIQLGRGDIVTPDSLIWRSLATAEERNGQRLPSFSSLDVFAEWNGRIRRTTITPYMGIKNFTDRDNLTDVFPRFDGSIHITGNEIGSNDDYRFGTQGRQFNFGLRIVF